MLEEDTARHDQAVRDNGQAMIAFTQKSLIIPLADADFDADYATARAGAWPIKFHCDPDCKYSG